MPGKSAADLDYLYTSLALRVTAAFSNSTGGTCTAAYYQFEIAPLLQCSGSTLTPPEVCAQSISPGCVNCIPEASFLLSRLTAFDSKV